MRNKPLEYEKSWKITFEIEILNWVKLGTTKKCAIKSSSSPSESELRDKSLKYKKSNKLLFETSVWVKKTYKYFFFQNMRARNTGGKFFFWVQIKCVETKISMLVRVRNWKQVSGT